MVTLNPIVRLDDRDTINVWRAIPVEFLTVRLQDVLTNSNAGFNKTFYRVKDSNGVHNFIGYQGPVVLSLVMRDYLISKFTVDKYVEAIETLQPDYFTTPDGETYEGDERTSWKEIDRVLKETQNLMNRCSIASPIGHVKGCNEVQVEYHAEALKKLGIESFIFHVGDFFRNGNKVMIDKARLLSSKIRPHAKRLILYGMGAQRRLLEFSFADAYVTYGHFTTARYGMMYRGTRKIRYRGPYKTSIVKENLIEMHKNVVSLEKQKRLIGGKLWAEDQEAAESAMPALEAKIRA